MRPSSRLNLVQYLPTIDEAHEDMLHNTNREIPNMNGNNSDSVSIDDYLHSVSQLAKPTFHAPQDNTCEIRKMSKPKFLQQRSHSQAKPASTKIFLKDAKHSCPAGVMSLDDAIITFEKNKINSSHVKSDPLEELYGQKDIKEGPLPNISKGNHPCQFHNRPFDKAVLQQKLNTNLNIKNLIKEQSESKKSFVPQTSSPGALQKERSYAELRLQNSDSRQHNINLSIETTRISNAKMNFISRNKVRPQSSKGIILKYKVERMPRQLQAPSALSLEITWLEPVEHFKGTLKTLTDSQTSQENNVTVTQISMSSGVSHRRSTWKDGQKRVCLLPAVAEI
ncbi:uncharacterized protein LOC125484540 [Rhincodon typus]|uniref:uncharacterized protein LOC125484540 n=1 Tax=Rhincodon typus TaxID=259920 RepID=UPI00202EBFF9|nr:uncharacterized protein LOC125484540 [Rhincodon typus]